MKQETINWDAEWSELVDPLVEARETDEFDEYDRLEKIYDRRLIMNADCKLHAERLIANLQVSYPKYEFAAHADALEYPPFSSWGVLVRKPNGRPLSEAEMMKASRAARAILRNIEKKYPVAVEPIEKQADVTPRKGCLLMLLAVLCLVGVLA